jgi:hypothetical protein
VRTINDYVLKRESLPALSRKSQELFKSSFNWQARSRNTYGAIRSVVSKNQKNGAEFAFGWIEDSGPPTNGLPTPADLPTKEQLRGEIQRLNSVYMEEIKRLNGVYAADIARIIRRPLMSRLSYIFRLRLLFLLPKKTPMAVAAYGKLRRLTHGLGVKAGAMIGARGKR